MSVFTIYFCGTGSNSWDATYNELYHSGELISTLATNNEGSEFVDWVVIDGPGSGNLQEDQKWTEPGNYYDWKGKAFGSGWEENVEHAMAMIKGEFSWKRKKLTKKEYEQLKKEGIPIDDASVSGYIWRTYEYPDRKVTPQELQAKKVEVMRKGKLPEKVNIIGWSRGGVTCHMLANAMAKDSKLKNIPVNIIAIDPVPGSGQFQKHRITIPKNVENYVAVYARDERSKGFACVIPDFQQSNKPIVIPMPGRHATVVGNAASNGVSGDHDLKASGNIVRDIAEKYLTEWGTSLNKTLNLSKDDLLTNYEQLITDNDKYVAMRNQVYTIVEKSGDDRSVCKGSKWKKFSEMKGKDYQHESGLNPVDEFINWHHKSISE